MIIKKFVIISTALSCIACNTPQQIEEEVDTSPPPLIQEPYFESKDFSYFDDPKPERCLKSFDVDGKECTEKIWREKLGSVCDADQIDVEYAKTCIWKQFEYCDEFGYKGEYSDETKLVNKEDVYRCTNYLMLKELDSGYYDNPYSDVYNPYNDPYYYDVQNELK